MIERKKCLSMNEAYSNEKIECKIWVVTFLFFISLFNLINRFFSFIFFSWFLQLPTLWAKFQIVETFYLFFLLLLFYLLLCCQSIMRGRFHLSGLFGHVDKRLEDKTYANKNINCLFLVLYTEHKMGQMKRQNDRLVVYIYLFFCVSLISVFAPIYLYELGCI